MATETYRKAYGGTPEGYVVVVGFGNEDGERFEVRQGVRTVSTVNTVTKADALAKALVA